MKREGVQCYPRDAALRFKMDTASLESLNACWCRLVSSDYSSGFGGKYGVQADRVDKSAVGFDYQGKTEKHESQKGTVGPPNL